MHRYEVFLINSVRTNSDLKILYLLGCFFIHGVAHEWWVYMTFESSSISSVLQYFQICQYSYLVQLLEFLFSFSSLQSFKLSLRDFVNFTCLGWFMCLLKQFMCLICFSSFLSVATIFRSFNLLRLAHWLVLFVAPGWFRAEKFLITGAENPSFSHSACQFIGFGLFVEIFILTWSLLYLFLLFLHGPFIFLIRCYVCSLLDVSSTKLREVGCW